MKFTLRPILALVILCLPALLGLIIPPPQAEAAPAVVPTTTPTPVITEPLTATITTPTAGPEGYRLKPVSEAEMLAMVNTAQQQLEDYYDPEPYGYSKYTLYLYLIQKETLRRFPDLKNWGQLYRDLVYRANIEPQTDPFLYDDFIHLLEEKLNSRRPAPVSDIEQELAAYNIKLTRYEATNLFGDGQIAKVWQLDIGYSTFLTALHTTSQGVYQLIPIREGWLDIYQGEETIKVEDYNNNGLPEIASIQNNWGHAGCASNLAVYEWTGVYPSGQFVNLAKDIESVEGSYIDHNCENVWRFGTPGPGGARPIIQSIEYDIWADPTCRPYQVETLYTWTGQNYQAEDSSTVVPFDPSQPDQCAAGWAELAAEKGLSNQAISLLESVLKDPSPKINEIWGPDGVDYLRFKLATWYAEQGRDQVARAEMERVRDQAQTSKPKLISQVAAAYLREYEAIQDPDIACWSAIKTVYSVYPRDPTLLNLGSDKLTDVVKNLLGFAEPEWEYADWYNLSDILQDICRTDIDPADQVEFLLRKLKPARVDDLVKALRTEGVTVQGLAQEQAKDNNPAVLIRTNVKDEQFSRLWLLQASTGVTATRLFNLSLDYPQLRVTLDHFALDKRLPGTYLLQINDQL